MIDLRVTDRHGSARLQIDAAPQAHVFIGRRRIPVHPVDAEVFFRLRDGFDGQQIRPGRARAERRDFVFVGAIGAGYVFGVGDFVAVEPDVGAIVDAAEVQPHLTILRNFRGA